MRSIALAVMSRCAAATIALGLAGAAASAADELVLRGPDGGAVRGLIIGIDAYRHYRPLKGAVADARDIESALRRMGTTDVTTLIDAQADRASVLREIDRLVGRTRPNDLIVLSIAGHGTQEPERVKGSEPDGMENVFLLPDFQPTAAGSQQRILGKEFNHFIKQLELRGAHVVFVADSCHGGGMAREVDPRAEAMSFRQVPSYRLPEDTLKPVTTASGAFTTELDFDRTEFLAAVDRRTKSPEVSIPGIPGLRGALSYAVARAIEGRADANADGKVTVKELFTSVRQMVYQLSNQRQNIVTVSSPRRAVDTDIVFELTRGVSVVGSPGASPRPPTPPTATPPANPQVTRVERPIRIAALDSRSTHFDGLKPRDAPFEIVRPVDNPDIIWDPASRDVITSGDVTAYRIDKSELPSIIDRAAAIRELKQIATPAPQVIKIGPDDSLHRSESLVQVELADVAGRALILFNITGDGTVQMLYPIGSDPGIVRSPEFRFPVKVREPFGADQIVAITSAQRMTELEAVLLRLNRQRQSAQMIKMVQRYAPPDARIGSAGLFTAP
jgi:caspase domain-containing protein